MDLEQSTSSDDVFIKVETNHECLDSESLLDEDVPDSHRERFLNSINIMLKKGGAGSRTIFTEEKLAMYIKEVDEAKKKSGTKTSREYDLLSRYDTVTRFGERVLISVDGKQKHKHGKKSQQQASASSTNTAPHTSRRFIHMGQLFDTIYDAHLAVGHGGEKRTYIEVRKTVANVTQTEIKLFISFCNTCNSKCVPHRKKTVVDPIVSEAFGERGQIDLVNMQKEGNDSPYKFILHYQDHFTKFSILRPLRTKQAIEVARHLLEIFTLIGAPQRLQSDSGHEFVAEIIQQLQYELWPNLVLINSQPHHSQSQESIERANGDIIQLLRGWMTDNRTKDWSLGLPFVQLSKNTACNYGTGLSPYKAVFGIDPQIGMQMQLSTQMHRLLCSGLLYKEDVESLQHNASESSTEMDDPLRLEIKTEEEMLIRETPPSPTLKAEPRSPAFQLDMMPTEEKPSLPPSTFISNNAETHQVDEQLPSSSWPVPHTLLSPLVVITENVEEIKMEQTFQELQQDDSMLTGNHTIFGSVGPRS
ncbi:KRAB-A domain-containing protein 2 [Procambarus clarkii]|uniref:KRAB-A domain-containing protein 2 n=1 Tax=Procambarus clarkii TaxID=6728 RepID=UPI001E6739EE|nr:KRAB-A domain-containing protein 2-like [Procambarus clarkii]XP_045606151.1 KRAB-A domain-containing protein 2-like [Procambarus clarkii]XP_045606152.1 KRAB-A domain-containing protein 2-like [Procambarus clarkii]